MEKSIYVATNEFFNIKDEVEKLKNSFKEIQESYKGNHQMNSSTPSTLNNWLERLRAASYDIEDLIDCWTTEYQQWKMKKQQTEDIGSRYFKKLSDKFFFECSIEDNTKYRMHDHP
ncbi:hypothetical protein ACFX11_046812 [Malus domestica]